MATLSITQTPPAVALADNDLIFKVQTDNFIQTNGLEASIVLEFNSVPAAGDTIRLRCSYFDQTFTFVDNPDNSGLQIGRSYVEVLDFVLGMSVDLSLNYYINKYFDISNGGTSLTLTAREKGFILFEIVSASCAALVQPCQEHPGGDKTYRSQYFIESKLSLLDTEESVIPTADEIAELNFKKMLKLEGGFIWPENFGAYAKPDMYKQYQFQTWENNSGVFSRVWSSANLRVLMGGISKEDSKALADEGSTWYEKWQENKWFLTWQPGGQLIDLNSTLKLYALITSSADVRLKWQINDDAQMHNNIPLGSLDANTVFEVVASPGLIFSYLNDYVTDVLHFDIWLERISDSVKLTEARRYYMDWKYREFRREFLFSNSYKGAYDTLRFVGKGTESLDRESYETESKVYDSILQKLKQSRAKLSKTEKANSGWLSREALEYMQEFLLSEDRYIIKNGKLLPVYITTSKVTKRTDGDYLYNLEIEYKYAYTEEYFSAVNGIQEQSNPVSGGANFIPQIGGGSGGHVILDPDGNEMPARSYLQFVGASVTDSEANNKTKVEVELFVAERRSDHDGLVSYHGFAQSGSAEDSPVWTITKITTNETGDVLSSIKTLNVKWSERSLL